MTTYSHTSFKCRTFFSSVILKRKEILISETSVTVSTRSPPRRSVSRERNFSEMSAARAQTDRQSQESLLPPATHAQTVCRMMAMNGYGLLPVRFSLLAGLFITRRHSCVPIRSQPSYGCHYGRLRSRLCYKLRLKPWTEDIILHIINSHPTEMYGKQNYAWAAE